MNASLLVFRVSEEIAHLTASSAGFSWIDPTLVSVSFQPGDKITFQTTQEDIVLFFSPEAVEALAIYDDNPCTVTATSPATFEVLAESGGNCCVTVTPADRVDDSGCTGVNAGILEVRWPGTRDPRET